eukprot:661750-Amphidinium_carterae.1
MDLSSQLTCSFRCLVQPDAESFSIKICEQMGQGEMHAALQVTPCSAQVHSSTSSSPHWPLVLLSPSQLLLF